MDKTGKLLRKLSKGVVFGAKKEYIGRNEAVCIDITDFKKVKDNAMFPYSDHAYLFIPANTQNMERAIAFLEYLDE